MLERCLEKEPANRYHEIADVRVEIAKALADPDGASTVVVGAPEKRRSIAVWVAAAVATLAVAAAGAAGWYLRPEAPVPVARFDLALPEALAQPTVPPFSLLAVSKDGTRWVVSTIGKLWIRNIGEAEARPLQGITAQAAISPTFSPDGAWLAYVDAPSLASAAGMAIRKLPVTGGTPQTVVPLTSIKTPPAAFGVDVGWDERNMLTWVQPEGIMQVSANGGTPRSSSVLRRAKRWPAHRCCRVERPSCSRRRKEQDPADGTPPRSSCKRSVSDDRTVVWRGGRDARYVPTGHIVYAQGNTLFAVPFDLGRREVTGGQKPLVEGLSRPAGGASASDTAQYAVSDAGSLLYLTGGLGATLGGTNRPPPRSLAWVDRKGIETAIKIRPDDYTTARLSPMAARWPW